MEDKLTTLLTSTQGYGLNGIKQYFATNGKLLIKVNQLRHHRFDKILPFLQVVHSHITDHEDTRLTFIRIIEFHSLA